MQDEILTENLSLIDEETTLPEGWRLVRIGDICQFVGGSQPPAHTFKRKPLPNYVRLVQIQDFRRSDFAVYIPESEARRTFDETDVMIGRYGPPVFQILRGLSGAYNVALMKTVPDESQIIKDYLYHLLKLDRIQNAVIAQSERSAGQSGVAKDFLENIIVPLPTIEEQRRIASVLDEQMKAVEQARLAVEEQLKAADLLPNAFLRVVFESEEAQNWQKRKLGEIAKTCSGSTPSRSNPDYYKGSISWVKTGELKDGLILKTEEHISELALKETSVRLLPPETLLVAMYGQGQTRGRTGLLKIPATTNQACFAILPNETFDSYFLQYWFRHNYQRLRQETEGRGGNQPNLNGDVLNKQIVSLPIEVNEQRKFVEKFNEQTQAAKTLKKSLTEKLEAVKKLPAALLRKAFAGEI